MNVDGKPVLTVRHYNEPKMVGWIQFERTSGKIFRSHVWVNDLISVARATHTYSSTEKSLLNS
jgi:hypothetical protein